MREIRVHAESGDEARGEGAAALGVPPEWVEVEILDADELGVTARVYVPEEPPAVPAAEAAAEGDADVAARAREHLATILELMGVDAAVELGDSAEDEVLLNIEGDDLGMVIGSFGQTLNALQLVINVMVSERGRRHRITLDAGGYRERRRVKLEETAFEHARRCKEERRPVILEGLRPAERRIIHTALQNDPDVTTFSEGEEPHRRLIISPRPASH
ncbi:MAG: KH domain-containing protein [Armatimonadetes bacterium]|nr:KH domain-containing protein [Armatimonadota bacterium]